MYVYIYNMVKRTTTTISGEYKPPEGAIGTNPSSDPLEDYKRWLKTKGPEDSNSYADFIRETSMKSTEGGKRRRKTITKSKSKKNKSKKNKSKKNKSKKSKK